VPSEPLHYTVTLINISGAPVVLAPCPSYTEIVGDKAALASYQLNCIAARVIPAGGSITFAMVLDLPASPPVDRQRMLWILDWPFPVEAQGTVTIVQGTPGIAHR
jgi:hypothetical protein